MVLAWPQLLIVIVKSGDKNGSEWAFDGQPERTDKSWSISYDATSCVQLTNGSIEKLIGRKLTWRCKPVEI